MSLSETYASFSGECTRGFRSLKRMKLVEGCLNAEDRNMLSVRKKDTRLRGEPIQFSL